VNKTSILYVRCVYVVLPRDCGSDKEEALLKKKCEIIELLRKQKPAMNSQTRYRK
jgi:hypothetical protein